jgi:hypothetical protein
MSTALLTGLVFLMAPGDTVKPPLRAHLRLLQVATVPGTAPLPLAQPPAVLRLFITPPVPRAPYVVVCQFVPGPPSTSAKAGDTNVQGSWQGTTSEGWRVGFRPYSDRSWGQSPVTSIGVIRPQSHLCYLVAIDGPIQPFSGHIYVNSDAPYSAGPLGPIAPGWNSPGYTFRISQ